MIQKCTTQPESIHFYRIFSLILLLFLTSCLAFYLLHSVSSFPRFSPPPLLLSHTFSLSHFISLSLLVVVCAIVQCYVHYANRFEHTIVRDCIWRATSRTGDSNLFEFTDWIRSIEKIYANPRKEQFSSFDVVFRWENHIESLNGKRST